MSAIIVGRNLEREERVGELFRHQFNEHGLVDKTKITLKYHHNYAENSREQLTPDLFIVILFFKRDVDVDEFR